MKLRTLVVVAGATLVLYGSVNPAAFQGTAAPPVRMISITVGDPVGEKMEYSRKQIVATPGERLRIRIFSQGQMPKTVMAHNWVLLTLGADAQKFADAAAPAVATDYMPPALKHQVLAATTLVGPGERAEVTFTVPKVRGTYPYLCTFAGHYAAGMRGDLLVK